MMRTAPSNFFMMLIMAAIVLTLAIVMLWIANSSMMPAQVKMEQIIPDGKIPR